MHAHSPSSPSGSGRAGARLPELEGFRALAVLSVMAFHYLQRFADYYPYGGQLLPPARYGWLGVYLFFIISGFVIALTLYQTRSLVDFVLRRIARLLPAMLLCALLTFLLMRLIDTPFTLAHRPGPEAFLPSLSFTDPWLWQRLLPGVTYVDGAYWSLFVEVRFYFWAGLVYFLARRRLFLPVFMTGALAVSALYPVMPATPLKMVCHLLFFPEYLALFCTGMLAHALFSGTRHGAAIVGFVIFAGLSIWSVHADGAVTMLAMAGIVLLFVALICRRAWLAALTHPALTLIGACSYSLYLIHQYLGVALITLLPQGRSLPFYAAAVALIAGLVLALAFLIFRVVEQPVQMRARAWIARSSDRFRRAEPVPQA